MERKPDRSEGRPRTKAEQKTATVGRWTTEHGYPYSLATRTPCAAATERKRNDRKDKRTHLAGFTSVNSSCLDHHPDFCPSSSGSTRLDA